MALPHHNQDGSGLHGAPAELNSISPQMAAFIKNLVDSQVQQQVQQVEQDASARWKSQFDGEWERREQEHRQQEEVYRQKLHDMEVAHAALQDQLQANMEAQEAHIAASEQAQLAKRTSTAGPSEIPLPPSAPPGQTPSSVISQTPGQHGRRLLETPKGTPSRGRGARRDETPSRQRRDRARSASPRRRTDSQAPRPPARQRNATAGPSQLGDQDIDMEQRDDDEDDESDGFDDDGGGRRKEFQLKKRDLPDDVAAFKNAFMCHIRILLRQTNAKSIPQSASQQAVAAFNQRFKTAAALERQAHAKTLLVSLNDVRCAAFISRSEGRQGSRILRLVCRMEDNIIMYIDTCLAQYGLTEWCPDWTQPPNSLYNSLHRIVAIDTFKQATISHAYASLKPRIKHLNDMNLLVKLYNHIVHYYLQQRFMRNLLKPGSVLARDQANPALQRRKRLAKARSDWLEANGLQRYRKLVTAKSTSDDEQDPEGKTIKGLPLFYIRTRPERSPAVTRFFRLLDAARERTTRHDPSRKWVERARCEPPTPIPTEFTSLPLDMPADYFCPAYFNNLAPRLRLKVAEKRVALLPDVEQSFTWCEDEYLSDADFQARFSADRLSLYEFFEEDDYDGDGDEEDDENI